MGGHISDGNAPDLAALMSKVQKKRGEPNIDNSKKNNETSVNDLMAKVNKVRGESIPAKTPLKEETLKEEVKTPVEEKKSSLVETQVEAAIEKRVGQEKKEPKNYISDDRMAKLRQKIQERRNKAQNGKEPVREKEPAQEDVKEPVPSIEIGANSESINEVQAPPVKKRRRGNVAGFSIPTDYPNERQTNPVTLSKTPAVQETAEPIKETDVPVKNPVSLSKVPQKPVSLNKAPQKSVSLRKNAESIYLNSEENDFTRLINEYKRNQARIIKHTKEDGSAEEETQILIKNLHNEIKNSAMLAEQTNKNNQKVKKGWLW